MIIRAFDLTLRLKSRTVLDRISFEVRERECVALIGPNGCGKTSVLRCLLGLVPFSGRAEICGRDVVRDPIEARRSIGYIPQRPAFGAATAREVLAFTASLRRIGKERIADALESVGLAAHADEPAKNFSGGMQQRLSLALVLLTDAPVLLLDEPTASLDRSGQETFLEIASMLRAEGRTVLLASHRSEEIGCLADRSIHLEEGRIVPTPDERPRLIDVARSGEAEPQDGVNAAGGQDVRSRLAPVSARRPGFAILASPGEATSCGPALRSPAVGGRRRR